MILHAVEFAINGVSIRCTATSTEGLADQAAEILRAAILEGLTIPPGMCQIVRLESWEVKP